MWIGFHGFRHKMVPLLVLKFKNLTVDTLPSVDASTVSLFKHPKVAVNW